MESERKPLVSIGVPVFNGEKGLKGALDSLLGQDYANLEIIISDNGSTDATPGICAKYCKKDSRVKYVRSEKNLGTIWNFNRVLQVSSGKYFMWSAHDDRRQPSYVSACVEKLEQCPDAVLCHAYTETFIKEREELLYVAVLDSFEGVAGLVDRYKETLKRFPAAAIYSMYRSSAMRKTHILQKSMGGDLAFIQELSIYGKFIQVSKPLFVYYGREQWNTVHQDYCTFFGSGTKPWWYIPFIALFFRHWSRVSAASIPFSAKLRLWGVLVKHEAIQTFKKILIKLAGLLCPKSRKEMLGQEIYRRWLHNPNIKIGCESLFLERVIKPKIGWWR